MPPTDTTDSKIAMLNDTCGNLIQLTQLMRYRASAQAGLDCCGFRRHVEDASTMRQSRVTNVLAGGGGRERHHRRDHRSARGGLSIMAKVVYTTGDDVSTDTIYPGRFMATVLPTETPQFCFADDKAFNGALQKKTFSPGSVIVAGQNFGCGSSREQAASALKGHDLVVVARGFARIFLQNSCNLGLRTVICPTIESDLGDDLDITVTAVRNLTKGRDFPIVPLPPARQAIIDAGGLIAYTRRRLVERDGTRD